jgi:hypothetical protein
MNSAHSHGKDLWILKIKEERMKTVVLSKITLKSARTLYRLFRRMYYGTRTEKRLCFRAVIVTELQRKSHLCIPFLGVARPQSQIPHSCVCLRFMFSRIFPHIYCSRIGRSIVGYILIAHRHMNVEIGAVCVRAIPFLGFFVSNFWPKAEM